MESGVGGNESGTHRGARFTGTEPVFGGFTHAATIVSNIRLTHEGKIFAAVNDLGAAVTALAREYRFHGDPIRAHQEMALLLLSSFALSYIIFCVLVKVELLITSSELS